SRKLQHMYAGPFKVACTMPNAVELELSKDLGIEPIQNISVVRKYVRDVRTPSINPPPLRQTKTGAVQEVEQIIEHARAGTNLKNWTYLVRWKGFGEADDKWISGTKLVN
ncbi:hypothetical protein DFH27DRAFT_467154, partial [Peziza echinospora]